MHNNQPCVDSFADVLIAVDSGTYALGVLVLLAKFPIPGGQRDQGDNARDRSPGLADRVLRQRDWWVASLLAVGSVVGAFLGARLALGPHAARWVFRLLIMVLGLEVIHLGLRLWSPGTLSALTLLHSNFQRSRLRVFGPCHAVDEDVHQLSDIAGRLPAQDEAALSPRPAESGQDPQAQQLGNTDQ
jgi:hypothetical protein